MRKRFTLKDELSSFTATMDARALEPPPIVHIELKDLNSDGYYALPHFFKYVAWFLVVATTVSSCTVLLIYGEYFSRVKTFAWSIAFLVSFIFGSILLEPAKIFCLAAIRCFMRKNVVIPQREINPSLVWNPENPEKKKKILNIRHSRIKLYSPTPLLKLQHRLDDIKYQLEMKYLIIRLITYTAFFSLNIFNLNGPLSNLSYYNNNSTVEAFLNARYTHSISFSSVNTYDSLMEYLNETLLPSLLPDFVNDSESIGANPTRRKRSWDSTVKQKKPPPYKFRKRELRNYQNLFSVEGSSELAVLRDTGWTINRNSKLLGKARIRQLRVRADSCKQYGHLKTRNIECAPEFSLFNVETRNFYLSWSLEPSKGLTEDQELPWRYQSAWKTTTLPIFTRILLYPGGGYVLELPKNIDDARIVLEYLDTFQWVDIRTRALFIEFSLYCVNTNFFDTVTLIIERSASGYFIPSYKIDTYLLAIELNVDLIIYLLCSFGILFWIIFREILRIHRTSFKMYVKRPFVIIDLATVVTGSMRFFVSFILFFYMNFKMKELQRSENNTFISLTYVAFWFHFYDCLGAILVCIISFQLLRFLSYKVVFYKMHKTISECYKRFVDLVLQKFTLVIAFALFFNLVLLNNCEIFSDFRRSLTTLLCLSIVNHSYLDNELKFPSMFVIILFLFLFVILISIFFVNIFLTVICLYYQKVQEIPLYDRYHIAKCVSYCLTFWRQKDIMNLKDRTVNVDSSEDPLAMLRLRGGGKKMSRKCKVKEKCDIEGEELLKVFLKNFVTKKPYDTTEYLDLSVERVAALKYLMLYHLSDDQKAKSIFSEFSLKALFCALTTDSVDFGERAPYFFVIKRCGKEVYDRGIFFNMERVVEDFGQEAGFVRNTQMDSDDIALSEKLEALDEKLCLLIEKSILK